MTVTAGPTTRPAVSDRAAEQRLMAALLRPDTLEWQITADVDRVRLDSLADRLREFRVLGLFGSRLIDHVPAGSLTPEFERRVSEIVELGRRAAIPNQMLTWAVLRLLSADGIDAVPLKGPLLAERLHGDRGMRLSQDVDILVRPREMVRAAEVLRKAGYLPPAPDSEPHLLHDKLDVPGGTPVELHWRIHWNDDQHADWMLDRAELSEDLPHFSRADDLISLLLVYSRDGLVGLSAPADIAAWWARYGDELDTGELAAMIAAHPRLEPAIRSAAALAQRLTGTPLVAQLPGEGQTRRRTSLGVRIAGDMLFEHDLGQDTLPKLTDLLMVTEPARRDYLTRTFLPPLTTQGYGRPINRVIYDVGLIRRVLGLVGAWLVRVARSRRDPAA
jgi:hypothetical protein